MNCWLNNSETCKNLEAAHFYFSIFIHWGKTSEALSPRTVWSASHVTQNSTRQETCQKVWTNQFRTQRALALFILGNTLKYKQLRLKREFEFQIISTVFGPASMPRHSYEPQMQKERGFTLPIKSEVLERQCHST